MYKQFFCEVGTVHQTIIYQKKNVIGPDLLFQSTWEAKAEELVVV